MSTLLTPENGWTVWEGNDPFENMAGPFFMKLDPKTGNHLSAFECGPQHMNGGGFMHGGMLMVFADYALFVIAHDELSETHSVTLTCQTDFVAGSAPIGEVVYAEGEVIQNTRSLVFVRGRTFIGEQTLTTFNGIVKKTKPRD